MNINTISQPTRSQKLAEKSAIEDEIKNSNYYKIANDPTEREYRRHEAQTWVDGKMDAVKRAQDIANNTPEQDYTVISITNCFEVKDMLKANGYRWNPENKSWYKKVLTATVQEEIEKVTK
jgi:hypothetical protein